MNKPLHIAGIAGTILLHVALGLGLSVAAGRGGCVQATADKPDFDKARHIEAALEIKGKQEKKKQPQKKKKRKVKPPEPEPVSRDAEKPPEPEEPEKPEPEPDEVDIESIMNKNRPDDETLSDTGAEDPDLGSLQGSEWGTAHDAKGDPYVGELKGRVKKVWQFPSLEKTKDIVAWGCVKLDESGAIAEHELYEKSGNANLDRSVEIALEKATDMEKPVPEHLRELLLEPGRCFKFKP